MSLGQNNQVTAILIAKDKIPRQDLSWCDQTIVLDAAEDGAENRNRALKQAKNRWVLFLKEDESVSQELAREIGGFINLADQGGYTGAQILIKKVFLKQTLGHGSWFTKKETRLGRRVGEWSEENGFLVWTFPGQKAILASPLVQQPYENLAQLLTNINWQTTKEAQKAYQNQKKCSVLGVAFLPLITFKKNFFLKLGFLDGPAGFVLAVLEAFRVFLVSSKLWLLRQQKKIVKADN
jgi:hypothetical protein